MQSVRRITSLQFCLSLWKIVFIFLTMSLCRVTASIYCQDDPSLDPDIGTLNIVEFTWLGSLQYIHIKNGTPHYFRVPRVVLVHRQFALSTALDASLVPEGYALGNIVFNEYEKDENECELTQKEIINGERCDPTVLLMPIADVLVHPEFKHFKVMHSIALLKLIIAIKSGNVLPVCLPIIDYVKMDKKHKLKPQFYYHIDFLNIVPRNFADEKKYILNLDLSPYEQCQRIDGPNFYKVKNNTYGFRSGCSKGCGMRPGAPSVVHEHTGHWTLVALAQGGPSCPDPLRQGEYSPSPPAPGHILIQPYVDWITSAIAGKSSDILDDPFGIIMRRTFVPNENAMSRGWVGKWWMGGGICFYRGPNVDLLFRFYHETFIIEPYIDNTIIYRIEINAPKKHLIHCVKVAVPNRVADPKLWDIPSESVKVEVILPPVIMKLQLEVEAYAIYDPAGLSATLKTDK